MKDTEPNDTHLTLPGASPVNDNDETEAILSNDGDERAGDRLVEDARAQRGRDDRPVRALGEKHDARVRGAHSPAAPKTEASSSRSGVRPRSGAPLRARSSRPGTPDGPCDTAPRYESPHPPRDRKGFPEWQSFAPRQRDRPAATVVYFCTAAYSGVADSFVCFVERVCFGLTSLLPALVPCPTAEASLPPGVVRLPTSPHRSVCVRRLPVPPRRRS